MGNLWKRYVYTCQGEHLLGGAEDTATVAGGGAAGAAPAAGAGGGTSPSSRKAEALLEFCRKTLQNDPRAAAISAIDLAAMQKGRFFPSFFCDFSTEKCRSSPLFSCILRKK
jgi:hypothetical protein